MIVPSRICIRSKENILGLNSLNSRAQWTQRVFASAASAIFAFVVALCRISKAS